MNERTIDLFIDDIIESIEKIERYVKGMEFSNFENDDLTIDGVIRNLEVIGEASAHIPDNIRNNYKDLPWKRIVGLRNIAIHGYFKIDLAIIWKIITKNIPETKEVVLKIKKEFIKK